VKDTGLKITKQRSVILDELRKLTVHPTADELYDIVKVKQKGLGLCTVYRNLENFYKEGIIGKIKGNPTRYDGNITPHNHIKCIQCGKIKDIFVDVPVNELEINKLGYKLHSYKIEINGLCRDCNNKKTKIKGGNKNV
jgi:Fur family transcriptional regulator, ferric uptake regulator